MTERSRPPLDVEALLRGFEAKDRSALARAITLAESTRKDDQILAQTLLQRLLPLTGRAVRLGISGAPGVGKSTFIEALGQHLLAAGERLAVLAIDPSSPISGGSILGDQARMTRLSREPRAFIRPSPAGRTLGGTARRTREALLFCEAFGHSVVLVETVGVGQSETAVTDMVDTCLVLLAPAGGDELQGIKKGLLELADILAINKADGDLLAPARHTQRDYQAALAHLHPRTPGWTIPCLLVSAREGQGLAEVWRAVQAHLEVQRSSGELAARRKQQGLRWFEDEVIAQLQAAFARDPAVAKYLSALRDEVAAGRLPPALAATELVQTFLDGRALR